MVKHTATSVVTIDRFIIEQEKMHPEATGELSGILYDLALAAKMIANKVRSAGLADILGSARMRQRGYFQPRFIDRIVHEHLSGRRDHTLRLWQLLVFELWHRHYVDSPAVPAAKAS